MRALDPKHLACEGAESAGKRTLAGVVGASVGRSIRRAFPNHLSTRRRLGRILRPVLLLDEELAQPSWETALKPLTRKSVALETCVRFCLRPARCAVPHSVASAVEYHIISHPLPMR